MPRPTPRPSTPPPPLSLAQRLRRRLTPTKLWNRRLEDLVLDAQSLASRGTTDFFKVVELETTTACNRRCSYCPNSAFDRGLLRNEARMSDEVYDTLLGQLADVDFTGRLSPHFYGEPLLDERLEGWISRCRSRIPLAKIVVFTNGDYLDVPRYLSLVQAGVDGLLVTQHSQAELVGVTAVQAYRRQRGSDGVRFDFRAFDDDTELSNRGGLVQHQVLERKTDCKIPAENITIDHRGNVVLCCNDYHSAHSFGNIATEHLLDIWNKPELRQLRRRLKRGQFDLEICKRCASGGNPLAEDETAPHRRLAVVQPAPPTDPLLNQRS